MTTQKPEGFKTEVDVWTLPAGGEPKKEKILVPGLSGIERSAGKSLVADTLREKASGIVNVKMGPSKHAFDGGGFIAGDGPDTVDDHEDGIPLVTGIFGYGLSALSAIIGWNIWTNTAFTVAAGVTGGTTIVGLALILMGVAGVMYTTKVLRRILRGD